MSTVTLTQTRPAADAVSVPAPSGPVAAKAAGPTPTWMRIDDEWYDLTHWKKSHPGGPLILEQMHGNDATDAFYSLHSAEAAARLKRLPHSKTIPAVLSARPPPPPTKAALAFRAFRAQLAAEGWFERSPFWEVFYALSAYVMAAAGTYACFAGYKLVAIILLGFAMQQAGWIGHDYTHGRGAGCKFVGYGISGLLNAFSRDWWSNKHNTHHVFTNYIGVDADIQNDPVFHLFFPEKDQDVFFRKMQHWYFVPVASMLYFSWRSQSLQCAWAKRNYLELALFAVNYFWMYQLGLVVALGSIYFAGGLVAIIVTATHQSEEMIEQDALDAARDAGHAEVAGTTVEAQPVPSSYSFCEGQFATTRDAATSDFFTEWLWGGMQYQLEHHLFPTMPKYYYSRLAPRVKAFAEANGLSYRVDSQMEILQRNFNTLKFYAADKQDPQNAPGKKKTQ